MTRSRSSADVVDARPDKPTGRAEVSAALVDATIELIIERGVHMSVREIAARAGVNHGLVHMYFGGKDGLIRAAADEVNRRTYVERLPSGFPPPDVATRRGGELAKAIARLRLDTGVDVFSDHPVIASWADALAARHPELDHAEVVEKVVSASALALGWALFADHLCESQQVDARLRARLDSRIADLVKELGGIPDA